MAKKKLSKGSMADKLLEKFDKENTSIETSTMEEPENRGSTPSSSPKIEDVPQGEHRSKGRTHKELRTQHVSLLLQESLVEALRGRADEAELSLNRYIEKLLLNSLKS